MKTFLLLLLLLTTACAESPTNIDTPDPDPDPVKTILTLDNKGPYPCSCAEQELKVKITTNIEPIVEMYDPQVKWIEFKEFSDDMVVLKIAENSSIGEDRKATVMIYSPDRKQNVWFDVEQEYKGTKLTATISDKRLSGEPLSLLGFDGKGELIFNNYDAEPVIEGTYTIYPALEEGFKDSDCTIYALSGAGAELSQFDGTQSDFNAMTDFGATTFLSGKSTGVAIEQGTEDSAWRLSNVYESGSATVAIELHDPLNKGVKSIEVLGEITPLVRFDDSSVASAVCEATIANDGNYTLTLGYTSSISTIKLTLNDNSEMPLVKSLALTGGEQTSCELSIDESGFHEGKPQISYDVTVSPATDGSRDDTSRLQELFDTVSNNGGGNIYFAKGDYYFTWLYMRSNIHLYIDPAATLRPTEEGTMLLFSPSKRVDKEEFIEKCSIQCSQDGQRYTVDYSDWNKDVIASAISRMYTVYKYKGDDPVKEAYVKAWNSPDYVGMRFITATLVRDFLIADANIYDNWTTYCAINFTPADDKYIDPDENPNGLWEVMRPTDGVVRNCSGYNFRSGYGLCQLHGALRMHYENIYSKGGITLRLESGSGGKNAGVFDITADGVTCEEGLAAVMMNPHTATNGKVTITNVKSIGSSLAVLVNPGFDDGKVENRTAGSYSDDCSISNIHAIFGRNALIERKDAWIAPKEYNGTAELCAENIRMNTDYGNVNSFRGVSLAAVCYLAADAENPTNPDKSKGQYIVKFTNITSEGFDVGGYGTHRNPQTGECNLFMDDKVDWGLSDRWTVRDLIWEGLGVKEVEYQ